VYILVAPAPRPRAILEYKMPWLRFGCTIKSSTFQRSYVYYNNNFKTGVGYNPTHTINTLDQSSIQQNKTHNSSGFVTGIHRSWKRQNAADTGHDIRSRVFAMVHMMKLSNQIQIKPSISDDFAPNLTTPTPKSSAICDLRLYVIKQKKKKLTLTSPLLWPVKRSSLSSHSLPAPS
jgi:hypothetical protein